MPRYSDGEVLLAEELFAGLVSAALDFSEPPDFFESVASLEAVDVSLAPFPSEVSEALPLRA